MKRGQMKLSFGMIFSIILIIAFVALAIYVIMYFLGAQESLSVARFSESLTFDVDDIWKSFQGSRDSEYRLPSDIELVCFADYSSASKGPNAGIYQTLKQVYYESENLIFYPVGSGAGIDALVVENIDVEGITAVENPYCIKNEKGSVKMVLKKDRGADLVLIERME